MEKRYMDRIQERADEFAQTGKTEFTKWELKSWFNAERISKNVWRTIYDHLSESAGRKVPKAIEVGDRYYVFDDAVAWDISEI